MAKSVAMVMNNKISSKGTQLAQTIDLKKGIEKRNILTLWLNHISDF